MKLDLRGAFTQHCCVVYIATCSWTYQRWLTTPSRQLVNLGKVITVWKIENNSRGPGYFGNTCLLVSEIILPSLFASPRLQVDQDVLQKKPHTIQPGCIYSILFPVPCGGPLISWMPVTGEATSKMEPQTFAMMKTRLLSHGDLCGQLQSRCFQLQFFKSQIQPGHLAMSWVFALCCGQNHYSNELYFSVHGSWSSWSVFLLGVLAQSRTCSK